MAEKSRISREELERLVDRDIREAMKGEIYVPYEFQFRASRLPFCSREFVIHNRYPKGQVIRSETYDFNFYVKIGTAIHEVIQQFLGMAKFVYGHWACCGVTERFREGSALCPVCGRPQKYEEFEIDGELGAHVDSVFLRYQAVGEFKSTSSTNLVKLTGPYEHHLVQASCYTNALNEQLGLDLNKIIFVYLSRDRPSDFRVFIVRPIPDAYSGALAQYREAQDQLKEGVLPDPLCSNSYEGHRRGCPYTGVCFHPSLEEDLIPISSLL